MSILMPQYRLKSGRCGRCPRRWAMPWMLLCVFSILSGCGGSKVASSAPSVADNFALYALAQRTTPVLDDSRLDALREGVSAYVRLSLEHSPALRAAYARWKAMGWEVTSASALPEPSLRFAAFLSSIETREGPQLARVGLEQSFPWPGTLKTRAGAVQSLADAAYFGMEAKALDIATRVKRSYWQLWKLRATRAIHREHLLILDSLAESVRARVATGAASLADLQQVELARVRVTDSIASQDERESSLAASLRAMMGQEHVFDVPTEAGPNQQQPEQVKLDVLLERAFKHPQLLRLSSLRKAALSQAELRRLKRYPEFKLGVDWTVVGTHTMDGEEHGGTDALSVGAGMSIPLWQGVYSDSVNAAESLVSERFFEEASLRDQIVAKVIDAESMLRDGFRRVKTYRDSLVPRSDAAYRSVLGAYTVGRGNIAQMLMAQRDLLEFKVELEAAKAELEIARVVLDELIGVGLEKPLLEGNHHDRK